MLAGWWWYWRRRWPCWGVGLGSWSVKMTETHTISYDTCWDVLGCTGIWFFHHVFNHFLVWCCFYFFGLLWAVLWNQLSTSFNQRGLRPLTLCSGGILFCDLHLNSWFFFFQKQHILLKINSWVGCFISFLKWSHFFGIFVHVQGCSLRIPWAWQFSGLILDTDVSRCIQMAFDYRCDRLNNKRYSRRSKDFK